MVLGIKEGGGGVQLSGGHARPPVLILGTKSILLIAHFLTVLRRRSDAGT